MDKEGERCSTSDDGLSIIHTVADFGRLLRARRKAEKLTLHDAAALAGVSIQFLHDLESGKHTIQMGRALEYGSKLGLTIEVRGPKLQTPEQPARKRGSKPL